MKIAICTGKNVINTMIDTTAEVVNEFQPDTITTREINHAKRSANTSSYTHKGPAYNWEYQLSDDHNTATFLMEIEDDAILMALPVAVKIAGIISPFYDMGKSLVKMIRNLQDQFDFIGEGFNAKFLKKYGKTKTYAVGAVWCEDLEVFSEVVVEDDGFGNRNVIHSEDCGKPSSSRVINKLAMAAIARGDKTKDSMTKRYPFWEFRAITREEAENTCRELRHGLQTDVDAYYEGLKETTHPGTEMADDIEGGQAE